MVKYVEESQNESLDVLLTYKIPKAKTPDSRPF